MPYAIYDLTINYENEEELEEIISEITRVLNKSHADYELTEDECASAMLNYGEEERNKQ